MFGVSQIKRFLNGTVNYKRYDLKVQVIERLGNGLDFSQARGKYVKNVRSVEGGKDETRYIMLKPSRFAPDTKIPAYPLPAYNTLDSNMKVLTLLKIDRNNYYPCSYEKGIMTATVPSPIMREDGTQALNADGTPSWSWKDITLFNTNYYMNEHGAPETVPYLVAHQTFDAEHWLASEIIAANTENRMESNFQIYAPAIVAVIAIIGCILIAYYTYQQFDSISNKLVDVMKLAISQIGNIGHTTTTIIAPTAPPT